MTADTLDTRAPLSDLGRKEYARLRRLAVSRARTHPAPFASAARCLERARAYQASPDAAPIYDAPTVWTVSRPAGAPFAAYGESALRWIERPESVGLRLVGLAHEAAPAGYAYARAAVDHSGWYLDADGYGETVAGVVYRLPGRDGRARYLAGYADPWNTDSHGNGPACLALDVIQGDARDSDWEADSGVRDAARRGDGIAESMAEAERERDSAYRAGCAARDRATVARDACTEWADRLRETRDMFRDRHNLGDKSPASVARWNGYTRRAIEDTRKACAAFLDARRAAHAAFRDAPSDANNLDAWRDGFAAGM